MKRSRFTEEQIIRIQRPSIVSVVIKHSVMSRIFCK